ncbi:hypothetical protein ID866_9789 [Astraeus odoratus]|nr:hypothetical protein ID866_9789 [Astraeus odoratus]
MNSNAQFYATQQLYGIYLALAISQALICSLATRILARLQIPYLVLNLILCFIIIVATPAATPSELKNSASYALGNLSNLSSWPDGFAFALSFLVPVWTIGGFDAAIHISEEISNAAVAAPWGIVGAIAGAGIMGFVNSMFSIPLTGQYIAFSIPIAARFIFDNNFKPGPFSLGALSAPVSAIAVLFMVFMLVVLCFPANPNPQASEMNYTAAVVGGIMLFAMTWYYFPVYGGVNWFKGPVGNVPSSKQLDNTDKGDMESAGKNGSSSG